MIFDLVVLGIIIISCGLAFLRGFIREVLTIAGLLAGGAASVAFGPRLTPVIARLLHVRPGDPHPHLYFGVIPAPLLAEGLAYGAIFLIVAIAFGLLSHLLSGAAKRVGLGPLNRTFGVLFGLVRAVLIISLCYLVVFKATTPAQRDKWSWLQGSRTRGYIEQVDVWLDSLIPADLLDKTTRRLTGAAHDNADEVREKLDQLQILGHGTAPVSDTPQEDSAAPPPFPPAKPSAAAGAPDAPSNVAPATSDDAPADDDTDGDKAGGYAPAQRRDLNSLMKNVDPNGR